MGFMHYKKYIFIKTITKKIEYFGLSFQTPIIKALWLLLPMNFQFWSSYLSMVAHHQILECWMIMHQIIGDSFEIDTTWILNLLELLLLKWLIYGNDYLTFYNSMEQKGNLGDM